MNLLLLLSAILSALTGAGGTARIAETPAVAAQMTGAIVEKAVEVAEQVRPADVEPARAPLVIGHDSLVLPSAIPAYQDRRRE